MVEVSARAIQYIRSLPRDADDLVWVLRVFWDPGDTDNRRSLTGDVIWQRSGARGWTVDAGGYFARKVAEEWGAPVAPGIYVDVVKFGPNLPAGVIDYENGRLFLAESGAS